MKILRNMLKDGGFPQLRGCAILAGLLLAIAPGPARGQISVGAASETARQWAVEAARNELGVIEYGHSYLRYRMHTKDNKGDQVREVIESKDGTVARLILKEGRPLTPEEDAGERERLQAMLDSPAAYARHVKNDMTGKKMGVSMIKLLPDAMLYSFTPGQPQRGDRAAGEPPEIVLDYKPNPDWTPPTMEAEALQGLQGRVWIDPKTHFMTHMEGDVFRGVNFGFGFVAHIYPGGKLAFSQTQINDRRWMFSQFVERVNVRALLVKQFREDMDAETSDFHEVKEMSYQDAIHLLLAEPLATH